MAGRRAAVASVDLEERAPPGTARGAKRPEARAVGHAGGAAMAWRRAAGRWGGGELACSLRAADPALVAYEAFARRLKICLGDTESIIRWRMWRPPMAASQLRARADVARIRAADAVRWRA